MKKIMIVDDSSTIRNVIKNTLISDFSMCEAGDGIEALKAIPALEPIDMFLLDVNMPNMNGLTLLGKIRELPAHKTTPIIMLTTESKDEFRAEAKEKGANGWIVKPCDSEKLIAVVKRLLNC